jgi:hypothetical protein
VVLGTSLVRGRSRAHLPRGLEYGTKVDVGRLRVAHAVVNLEHVCATDHLVDGAETELGHDTTQLLCNVVEEIDDMLGLACELRSELRILSSNADRASVDCIVDISNLERRQQRHRALTVALAHHDATHGNQRSRSKAPLLCTQKTGNSYVATSANLTVGLDADSATKIVENECLVRLGKTKLPRKTSVLDACPARGTGTTVVARDEDVVRLCLRHAGRNDTDADLRYKLHGNASTRVGALQVIDKLLQVLDG